MNGLIKNLLIESKMDELSDVEFKEGALRSQLKVPKDYKFKRSELVKLSKVPVGDMFEFRGKERKMTSLLKKRVTLSANLMKRKK